MTCFDAEALARHRVTPQGIAQAQRYVALLQGQDSPTLADIGMGCPYGTSALLHEVTELRILLARDPYLLARSHQQARAFLQANEDAHVQGLVVEYTYLQQAIADRLGETIGLGALVRANTTPFDYDRLVASRHPLPILAPSETEIVQARVLLARLRTIACGG